MTTLAQLRKTALSLPEATEAGDRSETLRFVVDGEVFAEVTGKTLWLRLPETEAAKVRADHPQADAAVTADGVSIAVADIGGQGLNFWLRRAWLAQAPEQLAQRSVAAETATAGQVGDLPKAIGNPATRALVRIGITSMAQVADLSHDELQSLHGVGPKAVRILRETLIAKED